MRQKEVRLHRCLNPDFARLIFRTVSLASPSLIPPNIFPQVSQYVLDFVLNYTQDILVNCSHSQQSTTTAS